MVVTDRRPNVVLYSEGLLKSNRFNVYSRGLHVASKIAAIMGDQNVRGEEFELTKLNPNRCYFVPFSPLESGHAEQLSISSPDHLFGGVVPARYMRGKGVTHGLVPGGSAPDGWVRVFPEATHPYVLPGFTVFSRENARKAASEMVKEGLTPRGKRTTSSGGNDQHMLASGGDLNKELQNLKESEIERDGYVIEAQIENPNTLVVGQSEIDGTVISYIGKQKSTRDTNGREFCNGGSDLFIVRGGFSDLLGYIKGNGLETVKTAIEQASQFDYYAQNMLGMYGSERTYDVVQGKTPSGEFLSGVTDPSWRIGVSSAAKVLAIEAFRNDTNHKMVIGSTSNVFYDTKQWSNYRYATTDVYTNAFYRDILEIPENAYITYQGQYRGSTDGLICYASIQRVNEIFNLKPFEYSTIDSGGTGQHKNAALL
jgi:hypothetical protein